MLIGNQGVGKNKIADRLCELLDAEREYMQLHRDTSVQSLTVIPLLEGGKITYQDSPLLRAAVAGRVLILDEVDKAPLEVVCLLKGLIGDGEIMLHDGRRLVTSSRGRALYRQHGGGGGGSAGCQGLDEPSEDSLQAFYGSKGLIQAHPSFLLIALANR